VSSGKRIPAARPAGIFENSLSEIWRATEKFISKSVTWPAWWGFPRRPSAAGKSLGLTRPQRTESRYRLYTNDDVRLLKKARYLRKVRGLNAAAIVQMLKREGAIQPSAATATRRDWPALAPLAHQARRLASPKSPQRRESRLAF
jgi:hypothetical protein